MADLFTLPKAELHLHIEGTLEPEMVFALARRNGIELSFESVDDLRGRLSFTSLQSFLDLYYECTAVLITEQDFFELATAYFDRAAAQGVRHVEMFFDPQSHTSRGIGLDTVMDGLLRAFDYAKDAYGISGGLIVCILRHLPDEADALMDAIEHRSGDLLGIGLDSSEVGFPPSLFQRAYDRAGEWGLHRVAHAGEEGPPSYVGEALDLLKVERIDHGVRSIEDEALVARLVQQRIPLTVCPMSNVRLAVFDDLTQHTILALDEKGLTVTVNSDDPAYFGGYVGDNFAALAEALPVSPDQLVRFARNSIDASFTDPARKAELHAEIDAWEAMA